MEEQPPEFAPSSIPAGLSVGLHRAKVLPGASAEADRWMQMLDDRIEECVATLDRERMAIEIVLRLSENDVDYLYWVTVRGTGGAGLETSEHEIDRDHVAQARRTKEPGWVSAQPQVLILPDPVRDAVLAWALRPGESDHEPASRGSDGRSEHLEQMWRLDRGTEFDR